MNETDGIRLFRGEYLFLSNFYPAKLMFDGVTYCNAESAYQAQKPADREARRQFSRLYADEAKRLGQKVEVRPDWDAVKRELMGKILFAKFTQNPRLAELLAETGDVPLAEGNKWGDVYWGVDLKTGEGENHLGRLLMELRQAFQTGGVPDNSKLRPVRSFTLADNFTVTDEDIAEIDAEAAVEEKDGLPIGGAVIAEALGKYVLYTASPVYGRDDEALLTSCFVSCLDLAKENHLHRIAIPILAADRHCFPKQKAVRMAVEAIRAWLDENGDMQIVLSCSDHRMFDMACEEPAVGNCGRE